jgi:multidrug efflux pump subunit AcrB
MAHESDESLIRRTRNTARFFTENRHVAWVVLVATLLWGVYGYMKMPKRKDPVIPIRVGAVVCAWPGRSATDIEQSVTRPIEQKISENGNVEKLFTTIRNSVSVTLIILQPSILDIGKELDDIKGKLDQLHGLPEGAGPIQFLKDFRDTSALMLTVASPVVDEVELSIRTDALKTAISDLRAGTSGPRASLVVSFPHDLDPATMMRVLRGFPDFLASDPRGILSRMAERPGFVVIDAGFSGTDGEFLDLYERYVREHLDPSDIHPDLWQPAVVVNPADAGARLMKVAGAKYTYRQLDDWTDLIARTLQTVPTVSKATRLGVLPEAVFLTYSQDRLAAYGLQPAMLQEVFKARNLAVPGGLREAGGRTIALEPSGEFKDEGDLRDVIIGASDRGLPVQVRDVFEVSREYQTPPRYLNFFSFRDSEDNWQRTRAVTLSVLMHPGRQIGDFGTEVDQALVELRPQLPDDLVMSRTSDQPLQVREIVALFMRSLLEAVLLIVAVAFLGFREWRSAVLMALSIPLTLAMTFGMMLLLGLDLQQVSIASLIIALGLLVDDPVVAGDAIKRALAAGHKPVIAAWLGPTRLANAILFATATNIAAYLPLLLMGDDTGRFIYSLPVVMTCSLVASRIVSMTFVPLLGYHLLRGNPDERDVRKTRFAGAYYRLVGWAIDHRWRVLAVSIVALIGTGLVAGRLKSSFFPKDLQYMFYVDVWLPEDAPLSATREAAAAVDSVVREVADEYGRSHPGPDGQPREVLESSVSFVGGGGPRFWVTLVPEQQQVNYAQVVVQVKDKHDTAALVNPIQKALSSRLPGVMSDVRELETAFPVGVPVAFRFQGEDIATLRRVAEKAKAILRSAPDSDRVRDDWGAEMLAIKMQIDPARANLAGLTNLDVALSSIAGSSGLPLTSLRDGDRQVPVYARLRAEERVGVEDLQNLYVTGLRTPQKVPLTQVASMTTVMEPEKLRRRNHFRTITVAAYPVAGVLPSQLLNEVRAEVLALRQELPPGYTLEIGGEEEEQVKSFKRIAVVMLVSIVLIYLMLAIEFRHVVKPLVVFAAIPFGLVGALASLAIAGAPFGFMAFLGCASLVGVIVSHVIVLFDFIEVSHEQGRPLRLSLMEAGVVRMRPVMITVAATVLGLVPLVLHGGPLWEPLCYAQIGGLTIATAITLLLVPVLYAIFVLDLRIIRWNEVKGADSIGN